MISFCPGCESAVDIGYKDIHSEVTSRCDYSTTMHTMNVDCPKCGRHYIFTAVSRITQYISMEVTAMGDKKFACDADSEGKPTKWERCE